jgi:hypothetical protein
VQKGDCDLRTTPVTGWTLTVPWTLAVCTRDVETLDWKCSSRWEEDNGAPGSTRGAGDLDRQELEPRPARGKFA